MHAGRAASERGTGRIGPSPSRLAVLLGAFLAAAAPRSTAGQYPARPFLDWRTVETEHFAIHYPRELEAWTLSVAARIEGIRSVVGAAVGNVPRRRVHVIVDDPYNLANGFAIPPLDWPLMVLWATPPSARMELGGFRTWGELLTVHEFAHLAHLTWPSRNPFQRDLWRLLPADLGPVLRRSPVWVIEGYATYLEGRLTGGGRPYGVWRPALLRQLALEGKLPTYAQLSRSDAFEGGAFPYLAGSAYLEWLARREGDSSLVYLWRRMSARRNRSFGQAFSGLYGDTPDALYGRFVAELTANAMAIERSLNESGGVVAGTIVQRLSWATGDPTISRDGRHAALVLRSQRAPARLVVWRTGPDSAPSPRRRRRPVRPPPPDPLDVPDRRFYPPAKRPVATLRDASGRAFTEPRFFADGQRILVSRLEPRGDGTLVSDLSVWDFRRSRLRRVTRGAAVLDADPSPDGRTAAALRCGRGRCDLVMVDLTTGAVTTALAGTENVSYYRPRYAPDGRRIAVSVHQSGRWRVALLDVSTRALRFVDPEDGAARYDVGWLPNGRELVWVSERGGIPNVETIDLEDGTLRPLTRVTGAALAPEPNPADRSIWFLSLHSRGLDVRRVVPDSVRGAPPLTLAEAFAPAVPVRPRFTADTLRRAPVGAPRPYGLGPRQSRWFPGFAATADGVAGELVISNADPIGRLGLRLGATAGNRATWRGVAAGATLRRRAALTLQGYVARQEPSLAFAGELGQLLDVRLRGGDVSVELLHDSWEARHRVRAGGGLASLDPLAQAGTVIAPDRTRALGFAEISGSYRQRFGELRLSQAFAGHVDAGGIGGSRFTRGVVSGALSAGGRLPFGGLQASATYGELGGTRDPFERFVIGGARPPLVDASILPQRIAMPALPTGVASGERVFAFRLALPTGPLAPYYWGASTAERGEPFERWHRVVGAELRLGSEAIPLVALPDVQFIAGYGRSLDPPYQRETRFYAALTYRR